MEFHILKIQGYNNKSSTNKLRRHSFHKGNIFHNSLYDPHIKVTTTTTKKLFKKNQPLGHKSTSS